MNPSQVPDHLSRVSTLWTLVLQAHEADPESRRAAQDRIMQRYSGVVYRYLLRILRDADAADEVFQEFALRFIQGGFHQANPEKGRFRDYLKISILRLVSRQRRRLAAVAGPGDVEVAADLPGDDALQRTFDESCRDEFLRRAWDRLREWEDQSGQPYFAVLDYRTTHPEFTSAQLAEALTTQCQPPHRFTPAGVRKTLERARAKYAELLLDEVAETLERGDAERLEQEMIELGLHRYCRGALQRRKAAGAAANLQGDANEPSKPT